MLEITRRSLLSSLGLLLPASFQPKAAPLPVPTGNVMTWVHHDGNKSYEFRLSDGSLTWTPVRNAKECI